MTGQKLEVKLTESAFKVELWKGNSTRCYAYKPYNLLNGVVLALVQGEASGEKSEIMLYLKDGENWVATQGKAHRLLKVYKSGTLEAKAFELISQEAQRYASGGLN